MSTENSLLLGYVHLMDSNTQINIVEINDWTALYIDGQAVLQDHTLSIEQVLAKLGIECFHSYESSDGVTAYAHKHGRLPDSLEDLDKLHGK